MTCLLFFRQAGRNRCTDRSRGTRQEDVVRSSLSGADSDTGGYTGGCKHVIMLAIYYEVHTKYSVPDPLPKRMVICHVSRLFISESAVVRLKRLKSTGGAKVLVQNPHGRFISWPFYLWPRSWNLTRMFYVSPIESLTVPTNSSSCTEGKAEPVKNEFIPCFQASGAPP